MTTRAFVYKENDKLFIANIIIDQDGLLGDGTQAVGPKDSLFDIIPFKDLKEGIYDQSGKFLGTDPTKLDK